MFNKKRYYQNYYKLHRDLIIKRAREWKINNPEKSRESTKKGCRAWRLRNKQKCRELGKERRKKNPYYHKGYYQKNKIKINEYEKKRREKVNPLMFKCHRIANKQIKIKSNDVCSICGTNKNLERHHPNYNKPLEITLLCSKCHNELHRLLKKSEHKI